MDAEQLITEAWQAVEKAGVPDALQETAFKAAIDYLCAPARVTHVAMAEGQAQAPPETPAARPPTPARSGDGDSSSTDEDRFFEQLAHESGVAVEDLSDILQLATDGRVLVTPPTRMLGSNQTEQAKTVIALVGGARSKGLGEKPINAEAIRRELDRKGCLQPNHFAERHLGPLRGFNAGASRTEIVATSKWLDEFNAAVNKAHGSSTDGDAS